MTRRLAVPAALILALLAGCGVPTEATPRPLQPLMSDPATPTNPPSAAVGPVLERLCLVKDDKLVRVDRRTRTEPSVDALLQDLLAGPTQDESDAGLTSALTGTNVIAGIELAGGQATVEVGSSLEGPSRSDDVLAYGQIVCTLDSRPDVNGVFFEQRGQRLGIPRPDLPLSTGPLTLADYTEIISGG